MGNQNDKIVSILNKFNWLFSNNVDEILWYPVINQNLQFSSVETTFLTSKSTNFVGFVVISALKWELYFLSISVLHNSFALGCIIHWRSSSNNIAWLIVYLKIKYHWIILIFNFTFYQWKSALFTTIKITNNINTLDFLKWSMKNTTTQ